MQSARTTEFRSAAIAVAASLGLHLLLFWLLPDSFQKVVVFVRPVEVLTAPVKIDESRLPPKLRFAETNPAANQAIPKTTPFTSSRNQTAAQPVPEKKPTNSPLPKSAGTSEQIRLAQGKPRSIDQSEAVPVAQPSISMAAPVKAAPPPGPGKTAAKASPAPVAANPDRCVWGSDWPHVANWDVMMGVSELLDLLAEWVPDEAVRNRILTDNPQKLFGFPAV